MKPANPYAFDGTNLLKLVEKTGARVVLIGDIAQTKAVEAGRPFDQLQNAGMKIARMNQQRQKDKTH